MFVKAICDLIWAVGMVYKKNDLSENLCPDKFPTQSRKVAQKCVILSSYNSSESDEKTAYTEGRGQKPTGQL